MVPRRFTVMIPRRFTGNGPGTLRRDGEMLVNIVTPAQAGVHPWVESPGFAVERRTAVFSKTCAGPWSTLGPRDQRM